MISVLALAGVGAALWWGSQPEPVPGWMQWIAFKAPWLDPE